MVNWIAAKIEQNLQCSRGAALAPLLVEECICGTISQTSTNCFAPIHPGRPVGGFNPTCFEKYARQHGNLPTNMGILAQISGWTKKNISKPPPIVGMFTETSRVIEVSEASHNWKKTWYNKLYCNPGKNGVGKKILQLNILRQLVPLRGVFRPIKITCWEVAGKKTHVVIRSLQSTS